MSESKTYKERVTELESQGLTTSDAQSVVDAEDLIKERSKMKHTKGPWHLIETTNLRDKTKSSYYLANKTPHVHGMIDGVTNEADLALIAAAPEMLEALELVCENIHLSFDELCAVKNALRKARGES